MSNVPLPTTFLQVKNGGSASISKQKGDGTSKSKNETAGNLKDAGNESSDDSKERGSGRVVNTPKDTGDCATASGSMEKIEEVAGGSEGIDEAGTAVVLKENDGSRKTGGGGAAGDSETTGGSGAAGNSKEAGGSGAAGDSKEAGSSAAGVDLKTTRGSETAPDPKMTRGSGASVGSLEKGGSSMPSIESFTPEEFIVVNFHAFIQPGAWGFDAKDRVNVELRSQYLEWAANCAEVKLK